jgi:hypothetical protein
MSDKRKSEETGGKGCGRIVLDEKNSIALGVSAKEFDAICNGETQIISVDVNEDTNESVLENIQGHLILCCDEMPTHYYYCYFWNGGVFPYVVKKDLQYIKLLSKGRELVLRITGHTETVKQRYVIVNNEQLEPDDDGDACEWTIHFEVEKCQGTLFTTMNSKGQKSKTYLLRWNPAISSFRLDDYRKATEERPNGFGMNWSVYEWEEAHEGDHFYMLRTGDDKAGIVFRGDFTSEPYPGEDWAGKGKQRYYMDMVCYGSVPADERPPLSIDVLEKTIPDINWQRGHSGELLSEEDAAKLNELWNKIL